MPAGHATPAAGRPSVKRSMPTKASVDNPFSCPHCGTLEPRFASRAGLPVSCPGCGRQFVAGVPSLATPNVLAAGSESADESDTYELEPPVARPPAPVFTDEELAPPEPRKPAATREVSLEPVGYDSHAGASSGCIGSITSPTSRPRWSFCRGCSIFRCGRGSGGAGWRCRFRCWSWARSESPACGCSACSTIRRLPEP